MTDLTGYGEYTPVRLGSGTKKRAQTIGERTPCCIPFCKHTIASKKLELRGHTEWICADHWRLVPKRLKLLRRRLRRKLTIGEKSPRLEDWLWRECKRRATEMTSGLR